MHFEHQTASRQFVHRMFEILPGLISWTIVLGMIALSLLEPLTALAVIISFDLYWLLRLVHMNLFLSLSYFILWVEEDTDWLDRCRDAASGVPDTSADSGANDGTFRRRLSSRRHQSALSALYRSGAPVDRLENIHHVVLIPVATETQKVLGPGIESIASSTFPLARILIVISVEESADDNVKEGAAALRRIYRDRFLDFIVTIHPSDLPGELRVKGANATWAARRATDCVRSREIGFDHIIASCFDADTVVSPSYFSCLTYHFLVCPNRLRASFQPIPVYNNNIWQAPAFARLLAVAATFFRLAEATGFDTSPTFSSHSISFKALVDVGFWPVDLATDDAAIYWKAFLHFDGEYDVVPVYSLISMDATQGPNWLKTVEDVYKQRRRWAWGAELIPIVMNGFMTNHRIPFLKKVKSAFRLWENNVTLHLWPYLLTIAGWLPAFIAKLRYAHSVASYNGPRTTGTILGLSTFGFLVFVLVGQFLLPRGRMKHKLLRRLLHVLQWLLVPFVTLVFNTVPALDAHTRLMTGRKLEFWITRKSRKTPHRGSS